jgi:prepilin-type processing-associated H-X9-DG protein
MRVATRHNSLKIKKAISGGNEMGRGNVSFCDGHGEFMKPCDALRASHSGNPYVDPTTSPF